MKDFQLANHIQSAVAVIDKNMTIVDANAAFKQRNNQKSSNVIGTECFKAAYNFNEICTYKTKKICPVTESFKTKKPSTAIHHFWTGDHAVVEEITATPVIEETGEVNYVVEEFRDVTKLLGLRDGIIGICSYCRKVRDQNDEWLTFEDYFEKYTGAKFSHGICEECNAELFEEFKTEVIK